MTLRTVGVRLQAEISDYANKFRQAGTVTKGFVGELDKAAKAGHLDAVANQAGAVGLSLAGMAGYAIKSSADFEKSMSAVSAATHASAGDLERLRAAALQAGKDTSFSATEAADGITELSKAGVSASDVLSGGLSGALNLAAAGQLDVGEAAETAASALTQFKLSGSQVPHIADLLAAGAGKAQGSVHDMGAALNQSGLVAAQFGLSIEDTTGTLAAFASAGLLGSDAGTSFKTMLLALANPAGKTKDLMDQLGIAAYDAQGQFVGITALAEQLRTKLGGLTQAQRDSALAQIFGTDAIRAANVLYQQGAQGIQDWIDKTNDAGYAAETASAQTDNLAGDIERLKGSIETLAIESGSGSGGGLRTLVQAMDRLVGSVSGIPGPVQTAGVAIAAVGGVMLLTAAGALKLRKASREALEELAQTGPIGTRAAAGLERATKAAGRVAVGLAAVQTASAVLGDGINAQTDVLGKRMAEFVQTGQVGGEAARVFGDDLGKLDTSLKNVADTGAWSDFARGTAGMIEGFTGLGNVMDSSLQHDKERIEALDQALTSMVQSGQAAQAAQVFDTIRQRAQEQGVSLKELNQALPAYAAAVESAGSASSGTAGQVGQVGAAADQAKDKVDDLKQAFDNLFGARMGYDQALLEYKQGIADVTKELKDGAHSLDINSQAGRDNVAAVLDQINKIKDLRQARLDHGEALDQVDAKYKTDIDGLKATMLHLGYTKADVEALIGKYRQVPDDVSTTVAAPGVKTATKQVSDFNFAVRSVPPSKTVPFYATTAEARAAVQVLKQEINSLHGKNITLRGQVYWTSKGDLHVPGGTLVKDRWGGVHEGYARAQDGLLRDAAVYDTRSPGRYMFAEPATGGEAFIPRLGDRARSMAILDRAAGWYGATVRPAQQYMTAPSAGRTAGATNLTITAQVAAGSGTATDRAFASMFLGLVRTGVIQLKVAGDKVRPA